MFKICLVLVMVVTINATLMQNSDRKYISGFMKGFQEIAQKTGNLCDTMKFIVKYNNGPGGIRGNLVTTAQRFVVLWVVYVDNVLSPRCGEPLPLDDLKELLKQSPYYQVGLMKELPSLESHPFEACAKEVHEECQSESLKLEGQHKDFCRSLGAGNRCLERAVEKRACKAKILEEYRLVLKGVADKLLSVFQKELPNLCKK